MEEGGGDALFSQAQMLLAELLRLLGPPERVLLELLRRFGRRRPDSDPRLALLAGRVCRAGGGTLRCACAAAGPGDEAEVFDERQRLGKSGEDLGIDPAFTVAVLRAQPVGGGQPRERLHALVDLRRDAFDTLLEVARHELRLRLGGLAQGTARGGERVEGEERQREGRQQEEDEGEAESEAHVQSYTPGGAGGSGLPAGGATSAQAAAPPEASAVRRLTPGRGKLAARPGGEAELGIGLAKAGGRAWPGAGGDRQARGEKAAAVLAGEPFGSDHRRQRPFPPGCSERERLQPVSRSRAGGAGDDEIDLLRGDPAAIEKATQRPPESDFATAPVVRLGGRVEGGAVGEQVAERLRAARGRRGGALEDHDHGAFGGGEAVPVPIERPGALRSAAVGARQGVEAIEQGMKDRNALFDDADEHPFGPLAANPARRLAERQEVARFALRQRLVGAARADHHRHLRRAGARHRLGEQGRRGLIGALPENLAQELFRHPGGAEGSAGDDAGGRVIGGLGQAGIAQRELHRCHRHPGRRAHASREGRRNEPGELREVGARGELRAAVAVKAGGAVDLGEARFARLEAFEQRRAAGAEGADHPDPGHHDGGGHAAAEPRMSAALVPPKARLVDRA